MYGGTSGIHLQCDTEPLARLRSGFRSSGEFGYIYLVKAKASILLERATRAHLVRLESVERDRRDIEIINRNADRLNREAADTLEYQQLP
jgi:hypothetical protein